MDEITGDVLNDAIYTSYRNVEKRLNIQIEQELLGAVAANDAGGKLIMAGDHEYEIISLTDRNALSYAVQGMLYSYADMPYIDLNKSYWCKSINDSIRAAGHSRCSTGRSTSTCFPTLSGKRRYHSAYFEVALKTKYARDDESLRMFDLIMDTRVYDLGDTFWCSQIRDGFIYSLFRNGSRELASDIAANKELVDGAIAETISALKK